MRVHGSQGANMVNLDKLPFCTELSHMLRIYIHRLDI
jgi:hypothetical protein